MYDDNAVPLLAMANYLIIEDLKNRVIDFLSKNLSRTNVLLILRKALELHTGCSLLLLLLILISIAEEIIEKCVLVLAKNFSQIFTAGASLDFLPLNLMLELLRHPSLSVNSEYSVTLLL